MENKDIVIEPSLMKEFDNLAKLVKKITKPVWLFRDVYFVGSLYLDLFISPNPSPYTIKCLTLLKNTLDRNWMPATGYYLDYLASLYLDKLIFPRSTLFPDTTIYLAYLKKALDDHNRTPKLIEYLLELLHDTNVSLMMHRTREPHDKDNTIPEILLLDYFDRSTQNYHVYPFENLREDLVVFKNHLNDPRQCAELLAALYLAPSKYIPAIPDHEMVYLASIKNALESNRTRKLIEIYVLQFIHDLLLETKELPFQKNEPKDSSESQPGDYTFDESYSLPQVLSWGYLNQDGSSYRPSANLTKLTPEQFIAFGTALKIRGVTQCDFGGKNLHLLSEMQWDAFRVALKIPDLDWASFKYNHLEDVLLNTQWTMARQTARTFFAQINYSVDLEPELKKYIKDQKRLYTFFCVNKRGVGINRVRLPIDMLKVITNFVVEKAPESRAFGSYEPYQKMQ